MDEVLAAKDWRCSPSFKRHTQQRLSCPPVATIVSPNAMQLIDEGEATHSCWRAAMVLLWGSLPGLPGRASPRHGSAAATQQTRGARRTLAPHKTNEIPSVFTRASSSSWPRLLNYLCSLRSGREELHISSLGRRRQPPREPCSFAHADLHKSAPEPRDGSPGRRLG